MTAALVIYSATFMRYSLAVTPANYLLFGCHFINECSQLTQGYRYLNWFHWGGREEAMRKKAEGISGDAKTQAAKIDATVEKAKAEVKA